VLGTQDAVAGNVGFAVAKIRRACHCETLTNKHPSRMRYRLWKGARRELSDDRQRLGTLMCWRKLKDSSISSGVTVKFKAENVCCVLLRAEKKSGGTTISRALIKVLLTLVIR
jgi:hypothetical protein